MIIIGGAGRNVGKTEFACRLIQKFSSRTDIYGLKVSSIYPDEEIFHGDHSGLSAADRLFEETRLEGGKDTSRMLRAGARQVFYLRSDDKGIGSAFAEFQKQIPAKAVVVCESNSLIKIVRPALFLVVRSVNGDVKARALPLLEAADAVIVSDGITGFPDIENISYHHSSGWYLHK